MADYIYTMESRLTPEQMRTLNKVQQITREHGMNLYLTGGAIRDILTGYPIRDLDFTVQGDPLQLQENLRKAGAIVDTADAVFCVVHAVFQGTGVEIGMARSEIFEKTGKPPLISPATINEDLRRRDFTCNAMALSLNEGSRGLLLDPFNGAADIEAKLLRILHSYAFLEDPARLIRATRFATRFGWEMEERTHSRYEAAREGEYIQYISRRALGYEIERLAYEENPIAIMRALEEQGWLNVLCPKWSAARADSPELAELLKTRTTMTELNITVNAAPAVMHFLTLKLPDADVQALQRLIPHRQLVADWKRLDEDAKELSKKLLSKEAASNSSTWKMLTEAKPEALLYLSVTGRNKTVDEKIKNFLGPWRQLQEKIPVAQMAELRITPQLPEYPRICREAFMLLLDGKLRTEVEIAKFLAPFEPPPPPPPPAPIRRGRAGVKKPGALPTKVAAPERVAAAAGAASAGAAASAVAEARTSAPAKTAPRQQEPSREKEPAKVAAAAPAANKKGKAPKKAAAKPLKASSKVIAKKTLPAKAPAKKAIKAVVKAGQPKTAVRSAKRTAKPVTKKLAKKPAVPAKKKVVLSKGAAKKALAKKVLKKR